MVKDNDAGKISNSFSEWRGYVIRALEDLCREIKELKSTITAIEKVIFDQNAKIAELVVKSGIWGVIGGLVPILVILLVYFINSHFNKVVSH